MAHTDKNTSVNADKYTGSLHASSQPRRHGIADAAGPANGCDSGWAKACDAGWAAQPATVGS